MFNTELILHLQGFDHPVIFWLMWFFSFLGSMPVIITICLAIAFGLDLKRGLVLINIVAWTAFAISLIKVGVDYPRPTDVDPRVKNEVLASNKTDLSEKLPGAFFESFSTELLESTRNSELAQYGFPSGHVAIQTSLWLSFLFLFRKRWILNWGIAIIILTALSRLYLGHHFLGDVLGGFLIGFTLPLIILFFIRKSRYLRLQTHDNFSLIFFWLPWLTMPFAAYLPYSYMASSLLGLNMAVIFVVQRRNFPVFHVITWKRILAAFIVIVSILGIHYLNRSIHFTNSAVLDFFIITVINFLVVLGTLSLSRRLFLIKYRLAF
jgi:membrane-associated phospholipid phosphatase